MSCNLTAIERLWPKISRNTDSGCWDWIGARNSTGYGQFRYEGKLARAHRAAYEPVTMRENILRGDNFVAAQIAKTHCPHGHPYDEANTYVTKKGLRMCRQCARIRDRKRGRR